MKQRWQNKTTLIRLFTPGLPDRSEQVKVSKRVQIIILTYNSPKFGKVLSKKRKWFFFIKP